MRPVSSGISLSCHRDLDTLDSVFFTIRTDFTFLNAFLDVIWIPDSFRSISPVLDTWTKRADMPTGRFGLSISEVDGKIYAMGGTQTWMPVPIKTMEEYTPEGWQSSSAVSPQGKLPTKWGEVKSD